MTPERWKQVDQLLQEALEREPAERAAFIAQACGGDDELRLEIESLLDFHHRAEAFIETLPARIAADLLTAQESRAGQTIGNYEIIREIGRGGMGEVYLARDARLGRQVALKLLPARFTEDAQRVQRFRQEARAASALNHPNIIVIYEIGEVESEAGALHFIAAEFIEGGTLGALIRNGGVKPGEALEVAMQAASALSAAHAAGIVHRDIKPENIMLRPDGYVKVLDFGLAKLNTMRIADCGLRIDESNEEDIFSNPQSAIRNPHFQTDPGTVLGTVKYMSPEQARGLETDARSDIFSLGVVLYEMIAGRRPFEGETPADVIASLLGQKPPPLADGAPDIPAGLQRLVDRMLAKDRARRFQTADELRLALKRLKQELPAPGDYSTREFNGLARLARRLGYAGADTVMDTAESPARATSGVSLFISRFIRSPLRKAAALATLALALAGAFLGWRWLDSRGASVNSIAVLPFANAGGDPQMEYLSDGITESLMQNLSQLPGLRVMARGTVFTYKGREADPRQVGAALNVRVVITGRVEERGDRLIIAVELADARDGARIWGEWYHRHASDVLTVQEEIVRAVAHRLNLELSGAEAQRLAKRYTENGAAYRLYLQGRLHYFQFNRASQEKALKYFQQAVAADPNYALAYTGIADVYAEFSGQYLAPSEAMPKAREAALKASALDDTLAEAHHSLALIKAWGDWDWPGAEREFRRALDLNPNAAWIYTYYAHFLLRQKRFDEALVAARRGYELDPLSAPNCELMGEAFFYLGRYGQAIEQTRKSLELNPNYIWPHETMAMSFARQGQYESAIAELRQGLAISRHDRLLAALGFVYAISGRRGEALETLAELEREARRRRVSPVYLARVHASLGDKERALDLLYQSYAERSDHLLGIGIDPIYDGLRSEPRFVELLRRVGLP